MSGCTRRAAIFLPAAGYLSAQPARTLSTRLLDSARNSTAILAALTRDNQLIRTATAFQLDESNDFITTADILRNAVKLLLVPSPGRSYPVDTALVDRAGTGLVRLSAKVPEYARHGVSVTQNIAGEDDKIFAACMTEQGDHLLIEGTVAAFLTSYDFGPYYRIVLTPPPNLKIEPALPILNTSGELVGVLTRRLLGRPNTFFVVPARRLPRREDMPPALPRNTTAPTR